MAYLFKFNLLDYLRGDMDSIPLEAIDSIIDEATHTEETLEAQLESKNGQAAVVRRQSQRKRDQSERLKKAHEYCRAVLPRRLRDFDIDPGNPGVKHFLVDADGKDVWRLRKLGDPQEIQTREGPKSTETKPYPLCFPLVDSHWQLADFGIGVGMYFTTLVVYAGICGLLLAINIPMMLCNVNYKRALAKFPTNFNTTNVTGPVLGTSAATAIHAGVEDFFVAYESIRGSCGYDVLPENYTDVWGPSIVINGVNVYNDTLTTGSASSKYDFGSQLSPVTPGQGITEICTIVILIAIMGLWRRMENRVADKFDAALQSAQDYSIRLSGVLPRDPDLIRDYFNEYLKSQGLRSAPGKVEAGVVRVTMYYDCDDINSALQQRMAARAALREAELAHGQNPEALPEDEQRKLYFKEGSEDAEVKNTCVMLKHMVGLGKSPLVHAQHRYRLAEERLEEAINKLRNTNEQGEVIHDPATGLAQDDPDLVRHRRPIFAFVVFETEEQQHAVIKEYDHGFFRRMKRQNEGHQVLQSYVQEVGDDYNKLVYPAPATCTAEDRQLLQDTAIQLLQSCQAIEAHEPSDINYTTQGHLVGKMPVGEEGLELDGHNTDKRIRYYGHKIAAWVVSGVILIILFLILQQLSKAQSREDLFTDSNLRAAFAAGLAAFISIVNIALPTIMKQTTFKVEINASETERQTSLVIKLTVVRFANTAILTFLVTYYNQMLSQSLVAKIGTVLLFDMVLGPVLRWLDIYNLVNRYCIAKRRVTQAKMNEAFDGTFFNLAERYTDVTKTFFVCLFYSSILPTGYGYAFGAAMINYFLDKYLLLRRWRTPPKFDATIANANRYFVQLSILAHVCVAGYFYQNWPFNCDTLDSPSEAARCSQADRKDLFEGAYSRGHPDTSETGYAFWVVVYVFTFVAAAIIVYYFVLRTCAKCINNACKCVAQEQAEEAAQQIPFSSLEQPDWYYPRIQSSTSYRKPFNYSDLMDAYQKERSRKEEQQHGRKWFWPGQLSSPDQRCGLVGENCFQSSLMIEYRIYKHQHSGSSVQALESGVAAQKTAAFVVGGSTTMTPIMNPNYASGIQQPVVVNQGVLANAL